MSVGIPQTLTAWGRSSSSTSELRAVHNEADLVGAMADAAPGGMIARGYGRSYGDACLNDGGAVLDLRGMAAIHSFNTESGVICCDAGLSYHELMRQCLPRGWLPAACPGTAFVSMGGAVANDVHGKNQHATGSFGDHIDWIDLRIPGGEVRRISTETDAELFEATVGGVGLTGVIQSLQFRMQRVPSNAMDLREIRVSGLESFLDLLRANSLKYQYVVGWLDALSSGRDLGRGILELARPSALGVVEKPLRSLGIPLDFPAGVLNRYTVRAFNALYRRRVPAGGRERRVHINKFLYPLDAIRNWNRMYGRQGVYQFQCVVPFADGHSAIRKLMQETVRSGSASFLAVLKAMERRGLGMLSFGMPGFTLALDFPRRPETHDLMRRLYDIVLTHGGRVYLAKDACLSAASFSAMYPAAERFKRVLQRIDPAGRMQSDMSRRLNLTGPQS